MGVQRWQSHSPLVEELLSKINVNQDSIITEIRGLNFVRAAVLMEQFECNSADIDYVKDLALKQFIAHDNFPGLFELMACCDIPVSRIKELSKTPIDTSLTFLNYKSYADVELSKFQWSNVKTHVQAQGNNVVKNKSDNLTKEKDSIITFKSELESAKNEIRALEAEGLELSSKSTELENKLNLSAPETPESEKKELNSSLQKVKLEELKITRQREALELKIRQTEIAIKRSELLTAKLKLSLTKARNKLAQLK